MQNNKPVAATEHTQIISSQQSPGSDLGTFPDTEDLFNDGPPKTTTTGFYFASFNYVNSILGSGVIGIPYALNKAGFGLGLLLLFLVAIVTDYSLVLMVRSAHLSGAYSYQGIVEAAFGYPGYVALSLMQFLYPFIAMVSYNIVVGDTITKVLIRVFSLKTTALLARRDFVVAMATLFVTVPLCLARDLGRLARWSLASLVLVLFILLTVLIRMGTIQESVPQTADAWQFADTGIIPAIGIMAFAFMCHHNVFLLYESIEGATQSLWDRLTHISVAVALVVSLLFGVAGYATFTGHVQGDLLENYCWYDDLMNTARLAFSFTILLTYPIECLVARSVLTQVLASHYSTDTQHVLFTLAIVLVTYFISITTDCLGVVLELNVRRTGRGASGLHSPGGRLPQAGARPSPLLSEAAGPGRGPLRPRRGPRWPRADRPGRQQGQPRVLHAWAGDALLQPDCGGPLSSPGNRNSTKNRRSASTVVLKILLSSQ